MPGTDSDQGTAQHPQWVRGWALLPGRGYGAAAASPIFLLGSGQGVQLAVFLVGLSHG